MTFDGEKMRILRKKMRLSQKDLAERTRMTQQQVSAFETGKAEPMATGIVAIADALECNTDYLLGRVDVPNRYLDQLSDNEASYLARARRARFGRLDSVLDDEIHDLDIDNP